MTDGQGKGFGGEIFSGIKSESVVFIVFVDGINDGSAEETISGLAGIKVGDIGVNFFTFIT